jgi:nicotinate-nucleotide pyrophosphorylase (carboxylating)
VASDKTTASVAAFLRSQGISTDFKREFVVVAKESGVFCGTDWVTSIGTQSGLEIRALKKDGDTFDSGALLIKGRGPWQQVLSTERVLLNQLQWICGVATLTRRVVERVHGSFEAGRKELGWQGAAPIVLHTRKIRAAHRDSDIQAVLAGGGRAHRRDLSEFVLLKENHKVLAMSCNQKWAELVKFVLSQSAGAWVEVESKTEAFLALKAGARNLLFDNFSPAKLSEALSELRSLGYLEQMQVEVSGGLNLSNVSTYVMPGVHRLSVGALTHSAMALNLSLDWVQPS